jgi:hypothetical protein
VPLIFPAEAITVRLMACLLANLCSLVLDYCARQKIGGTTMNYYILKQLPVLPPTCYSSADQGFIAPRVASLVGTAKDLEGLSVELGASGLASWGDGLSRARVRAELDAYFATLYGLSSEELTFVLDPCGSHGADYPSETFRVLRDKEIRQFGEYRTRRLVLEAWDRLDRPN